MWVVGQERPFRGRIVVKMAPAEAKTLSRLGGNKIK